MTKNLNVNQKEKIIFFNCANKKLYAIVNNRYIYFLYIINIPIYYALSYCDKSKHEIINLPY